MSEENNGRMEMYRDSILRNARLRAACYAMIDLVEGPGCIRWQDANGFRLKDSNEWVQFYVAVKNVQNNTPLDESLTDDQYRAECRKVRG